jgi:hypothetical protein
MGKYGATPETNTIPCSSMPETTTLFYTVFVPQSGNQGTWTITAYVTGSRRNKSNTVIYTAIAAN